MGRRQLASDKTGGGGRRVKSHGLEAEKKSLGDRNEEEVVSLRLRGWG